MGPEILVTGGSGLLGSQIIQALLERGYDRVTGTYHVDPNAIPVALRQAIPWIPLDLPDAIAAREAARRKEVIIHAAGLVSYRKRDREPLLSVNRDGTGQIVNAALDAGASHLVYVGSIAALGKDPDRPELAEESPWLETGASTPYGLSKYLGELECWRGAAEGLGLSVVLPSVFLGPGKVRGPNQALLRQVTRKPAWAPGGSSGFVDVRDVAEFIVRLVEHGPSQERWLLSAGDLTWADLFHQVASRLGIGKAFRIPPEWMMEMYYCHLLSLAGKAISPEMIRQLYSTFQYDAGKSRSFPEFTYRTLDQTLDDLATSLLDSPFG